MSEPVNGAVAFLLIVSNFVYLFPALLAWFCRYFELVGYLITVFVVSSMHHLCKDWGICFGVPPEIFLDLDMSFALIAVGMSMLSVAIYELIKVNRMRSLVREGYTVRMYPMTRYGDKSEYVLVKHTYADIWITFLVVITIISVLILENNDIVVYVILGVFILLAFAFHWILYWRFKISTRSVRYYWPALALWFIFTVLSLVIFMYLERVHENRELHALWHITGALGCASWIIGTTAFFI
jgi:hypothetical protein